MVGILAEKPSASRNFAKALGGMAGTYDGTDYTIVAARGHLYEFLPPEKQVPSAFTAQYHSWDMKYLPWDEKLFSWKKEKKKDTSALLTQIKKVLSKCDEVCIATDVDPTGEGELLAWEILDELNIRPKKFTRMYFSDESEKEVQKAFKTRKTLPSMTSDMDYVKALYRSQWDLLSMQFTRIATRCTGNKAVIRQGRLKSVMVKITGDGLKALADYKRKPFYQNKFKDENGVTYADPNEPRFDKKEDVPQNYHDSRVIKDSTQEKHTAPPKLIDLAALSSRLAGKGYKAKTVLDVYQKMYEAQVVSYPRTEDKVITPEQFNDLLPKIDKIAKVVGVDPAKLTHRTPRTTHVKTGGAHGANRPGPNVPNSLDDLKTYGACAPAIYEILAKNYLAMLAEDYVYDQQKGHLEDYPSFKGTASVPKSLGWKAVFNDDSDPDADENSKGLGIKASPFIAEGANPKPPVPTMKWLMKQLEKNDVGTGATRTSTYADVTSEKTKYPLLIEKRGKLSMSEFGEISYALLGDTYIGDVKVTEALMKEMRDIADGKLQPAEGLHRVRDMVTHDMTVMKKNAAGLSKGGTVMAAGDKEYYSGPFNGKDIRFNRNWGGHRFTDDECEDLLAGRMISFDAKSKAGKDYTAKGKLEEQEYNGHKFFGFKLDTNRGAGNGVPDEWCSHKFTEDEKLLLESGHTVHIEGCVSKKNNVFDCDVKFGKNDRGCMAIIPLFNK